MLSAKVSGHKITSINEIMPMIGARFYGHIENLQLKSDYLEDELSKVLHLFIIYISINLFRKLKMADYFAFFVN